jgi:hypothetical protein
MSPAISNKSANHGDPVTYAIMAATFLSKVTTTDCVFSKVDLDRFQTTITEHLKLPATRECLNGDIKRLTDMVMSIETCFADIYHQMTRIDNKKLVLDHNGQSVEFAPKWKILHDVGPFGTDVATNSNFELD